MTVFSVRLDGELLFTWEGDIGGLESDFLDLRSRRGLIQHGIFARNCALMLHEIGLPDDPERRVLQQETEDPLFPGAFRSG